MKKIISVFILTTMLFSTMISFATTSGGVSHSAIVGETKIMVTGQATEAANLPMTLKVSDGGTLVHVDQMIMDSEGNFSFEFPVLPAEVNYTYTLRHPRVANVVSGSFYISTVGDKQSVLANFRRLNVGPNVADRVSVMTAFLTTPLHAQVLNLNLDAFNALNNPSAVSEGMCDAFNGLTTLDLISAKFAELIIAQNNAENKKAQQEALIQDINAASTEDMLDMIVTNAEFLGAKTEYGFESIKAAFDDGDTAQADALKTALQGAVTPEDFNKALSEFSAVVSFNEETWGKFDTLEQYYGEHIGNIFAGARDALTDLEVRTLQEAMQNESFADLNAVKSFISTKTAAIIASRPPVTQYPVGGFGGGQQMVQGSYTPETSNKPATGFTDCEHVGWAKESIERLKSLGIVNGKSATSFSPDDKTTREEFLKMLLLACDIKPDASGETGFSDVAAGSWCAPYIKKAIDLGIVTGISETDFGVGREITRQDMAVLCYRMLTKLNKQPIAEGNASFADASSIAGYASVILAGGCAFCFGRKQHLHRHR